MTGACKGEDEPSQSYHVCGRKYLNMGLILLVNIQKLELILRKTETTRNRGKNKINKRNNLEV